MTQRKVNLGLLYAGGAPAKWFRGVVAGVDDAIGTLCVSRWQKLRAVPVAKQLHVQRRTRMR
jgi:hypothetical protein